MGLLMPSPDLVPFGLRAMKVVAMADGRFDDRERRVLTAARDALGLDVDVDALPAIEPDELAAALTDPDLRKQLVAGLLLVAMADEDASEAELIAIERFAAGLAVETPYLTNLRRLVEGHTLIMRFDLARRVWPRQKIAAKIEAEGLPWLLRTLAALSGVMEDTALATKYRALEGAPRGSLGRGYFDFVRSNGFSLPGEKGAPPEPVIYHDMTHVLTGYLTDPAGEMQVAFFHAGCKKVDPFFFTFFALLQFHMGLRATPISPGQRGYFDPAKELAALRRGSSCSMDPLDGWEPWDVIDEPLEALRERYGIGAPPPWEAERAALQAATPSEDEPA